ncbi:MAG TPA: KilA-N domain-containing protein [Puia sp.]|nr:KilA-N domain-containing protein [Puia sp.]
MTQEKSLVIRYHDDQIDMFSDDRADYISLTDMARAFKGSKSIEMWLRNAGTISFLSAWEKLNNTAFRTPDFGGTTKKPGQQHFNLSVKLWIELTGATGIFARARGTAPGTYAHKDIAFKFASWLSPEFELFIVKEFQRLKELEQQKNSYELLSHDQILKLVRLKEVFKFVAHQEIIEDAHKEVFAAQSGSRNPFAEFNTWRNKILDIEPDVINDRIRQYCIDNKIPISSKILKKSKRDKILLIDTYEAVRNAVWDFLQIEGEVNALNLANLVSNMIRIEKGEVLQRNETDLFHQKQDLGEFSDFDKAVGEIKMVKTAREVLAIRNRLNGKSKELSNFDKTLKGILSVPPPQK